jgi:hypothetical protein
MPIILSYSFHPFSIIRPVNLPVGGFDLALQERLRLWQASREHRRHRGTRREINPTAHYTLLVDNVSTLQGWRYS